MKKIKLLTIVLTIVLITMISFCGVFVQNQNRMVNVLPEYSLTMDLKGARNIRLEVNTEGETIIKDAEGKVVEDAENLTDDQIAEKGYIKEQKVKNNEDVKNTENYDKSKKIIENRLKELDVQEYVVNLDEKTGNILVKIPENEKTDHIVSIVSSTGKFEILDSETNEVLMDNSDIETANVLYSSNSSLTDKGTVIYLGIDFTKDGAKKLEEISNKYVKSKGENETDTQNIENEDKQENDNSGETESETTEKKVTMKIDGQEIMSSSFEETIKTGKLQLSIGRASTEEKTIKEYAEQASSVAMVLKTGNMPIVYNLSENSYILSDIIEDEIIVMGYIFLGIIILSLIVLFVKYKKLALPGIVSIIGFISMLLITIRYTNVALSIEGLLGFLLVFALDFVFIWSLLNNYIKKERHVYKEVYTKFFIKIVPIIILVITFCLTEWLPISSLGMVMFWGILLIALHNVIVTNSLLNIVTDKEKR